jgi:hypothetical protein
VKVKSLLKHGFFHQYKYQLIIMKKRAIFKPGSTTDQPYTSSLRGVHIHSLKFYLVKDAKDEISTMLEQRVHSA